jgi:hypothetical protein
MERNIAIPFLQTKSRATTIYNWTGTSSPRESIVLAVLALSVPFSSGELLPKDSKKK